MKRREMLAQHARALVVLALFAAVSSVALGYILIHERVPNPLEDRYRIRVELQSASAVAPGFGQPITVAGVNVGDITAVHVARGRAIVEATIRSKDLPHVRRGATAVLAPRTPLKDMELELTPGPRGAPNLPDGALISVRSTTVPVDSDELTAALDGDTRAYLQTLIEGAGVGLTGRGGDLQEALRALRPTVGQLDRISTALVGRRRELARLVHNLGLVSSSVAAEDPALGKTLDAAAGTLSATAVENVALTRSLKALPSTLAAVRGGLGDARTLAAAAIPATVALTPAARRLAPGLMALDPVVRQATPLLRDRVRPLARDAQPFLEAARPSVRRLTNVTPPLTQAMSVLQYLGNELGYKPQTGHGYLFWLAWAAHNTDSFLSNGDANGSFIRGFNVAGCQTVASNDKLAPAVQALAPAIAALCPKDK